MRGKIASSNWSAGAQIGGTVATTAAAGMMNVALLAMAQSSHTIATMTVNLQPRTEDIMSGHMKYIYHTASTAGSGKVPAPVFDDDITFLRWMPEDSVYFVNQKGSIVSVTDPEYLDLSEYERFQRRWRIIRDVGTTVSVLGGVGMTAGGITLAVPRETKGAIAGGIIMSIAGCLLATFPSVFIFSSDNAGKYFRELNKNQMEKLRKKRQGATIAVSPVVNPVETSAGVSVGVTY